MPHFDLRVAAARGLISAGIEGRDDLDAVTALMRQDGVQQFGDRTALVWGIEDGKRFTSVTTALHEAEEREFISLAERAAADRSGAIPGRLPRSAYRTIRIALHRRTRQDAAGCDRAAGKRWAVQRCNRRRRCRKKCHAQTACGGMA